MGELGEIMIKIKLFNQVRSKLIELHHRRDPQSGLSPCPLWVGCELDVQFTLMVQKE